MIAAAARSIQGQRENSVQPSEIDYSSYAALAAFRFQIRRFFVASEAMLQAGGVPPSQYQAMLAIMASGSDSYTLSDLAADLFIRLNSAVELADRMEAAGLIERSRDPADRRRALIKLSATGFASLEELARLHLVEHRRLLPGLSEAVSKLQATLEER